MQPIVPQTVRESHGERAGGSECYAPAMLRRGSLGLLLIGLVACGGRAATDASLGVPESAGASVAGSAGTLPVLAAEGGSAGEAGAESGGSAGVDCSMDAPEPEPVIAEAGASGQCADTPAPSCEFYPFLSVCPPFDRHNGRLAHWEKLAPDCAQFYGGLTSLQADHFGCLSLAADEKLDPFGSCLLEKLGGLSFACAADQRLLFSTFSGPK